MTATTPEAFITITYWVGFVAIGLIPLMPLITSGMNALPVEKSAQGSASNNIGTDDRVLCCCCDIGFSYN
ncbi:hypothetical protein ICE98_00252 [Lactococcus lactis]|nr:hypothetical protein [Lactococcus lactis]